MTLEVLVAAVDQTDYSLLSKMNLHSDAIVCNQCANGAFHRAEIEFRNKSIKWFDFDERGVGLNRNNALMRATGDIVLFGDDDIEYFDNYPDIIREEYQKNPAADMIIFNLCEDDSSRYVIEKTHRVRWHNFMRYGTARITARRGPVIENGILFNLSFGGGAKYSHGEDTIFLRDCLKKGLIVYASPKYIGRIVNERDSSWNHGYTEKYLRDQGVLYRQISKTWYKALCLQDAIRHADLYGISWRKAYRAMVD